MFVLYLAAVYFFLASRTAQGGRRTDRSVYQATHTSSAYAYIQHTKHVHMPSSRPSRPLWHRLYNRPFTAIHSTKKKPKNKVPFVWTKMREQIKTDGSNKTETPNIWPRIRRLIFKSRQTEVATSIEDPKCTRTQIDKQPFTVAILPLCIRKEVPRNFAIVLVWSLSLFLFCVALVLSLFQNSCQRYKRSI